MFDQILQQVKEHMGNNPEIAAAIPPEQAEAVHQEIATHINNGLQNQAATPGSSGGILNTIENSLGSGNLLTSGLVGGLIGSLGSKFGLSSAVTGAIAASMPGLLQRFTNKTNVPGNPANPPA
jgi:hypothetical protein